MAEAFQLDIVIPTDDLNSQVEGIWRDNLPFVTAYALTKTAQDVRQALRDEMRNVFDRPTRFTLNALQVIPATKRDLRAAVTFKQGFGSIPASKYLGPEVHGGERKAKKFESALRYFGILGAQEYAVPAGAAPLDAYGNVPGPLIVRILSQLKAAERTLGYQANATNSRRSRAKRRKHGNYFVVRNSQGGAPDGIYHRVGTREADLIFLFVRGVRYGPRLPYYDIARRVKEDRFPYHFAIAWERYGGQRKPR